MDNGNIIHRRGGARPLSEVGRERKSKSMRAYWETRREDKLVAQRKRKEQEAIEARRQAMHSACAAYNPQPILGMTNTEAWNFACRQALETENVLRLRHPEGMSRRMDNGEVKHFRRAVYDSILYFNTRSEEHERVLAFRQECRRAQEEAQRIREEQRLLSQRLVVDII